MHYTTCLSKLHHHNNNRNDWESGVKTTKQSKICFIQVHILLIYNTTFIQSWDRILILAFRSGDGWQPAL